MKFFAIFLVAFAALAMAAPNVGVYPQNGNALAARTAGGDGLTISFDLHIIQETVNALKVTLFKTGNFLERDLQFVGSALVKLVKFVEDIIGCLGSGFAHFTEDLALSLIKDFKKAEATTEWVVKGLVEKIAEIRILQHVEEDLVKLSKGIALVGQGLITRVPAALASEVQIVITAFEQTLGVAVGAYSTDATVSA